MMVLLEPVLDEAGVLRLASEGEQPVRWTVDGESVGWSFAGEAIQIQVSAGRHEVWADGPADALTMARAAPAAGDGVVWVPAWTARFPEPAPDSALPRWLLPLALVAAAVAVLRRSKAP